MLFASLLPDIDCANSLIGRKTKIISFFFTHRGFFHSITAMALFSMLIYAFIPDKMIVSGFFLGYSSHLLLDSFNKSGIQWLWPVNKRIKGFIKTGGITDFILCACSLLLSAMIIF